MSMNEYNDPLFPFLNSAFNIYDYLIIHVFSLGKAKYGICWVRNPHATVMRSVEMVHSPSPPKKITPPN